MIANRTGQITVVRVVACKWCRGIKGRQPFRFAGCRYGEIPGEVFLPIDQVMVFPEAEPFCLIQDNSPIHTNRAVLDWFQEHRCATSTHVSGFRLSWKCRGGHVKMRAARTHSQPWIMPCKHGRNVYNVRKEVPWQPSWWRLCFDAWTVFRQQGVGTKEKA